MQRRSRLSAPGLAKAFGFFVKGATESLPGLSTLGVPAYLCALPPGVKHLLGYCKKFAGQLLLPYRVWCRFNHSSRLTFQDLTRQVAHQTGESVWEGKSVYVRGSFR